MITTTHAIKLHIIHPRVSQAPLEPLPTIPICSHRDCIKSILNYTATFDTSRLLKSKLKSMIAQPYYNI